MMLSHLSKWSKFCKYRVNLLTYLFTMIAIGVIEWHKQKGLLKVAYYSFIRVQEVYTINVQISFIFLHQYSDNK